MFAALCCPGLIGCQSRPVTVPVSGTVTLDGQPLSEGEVYFKTVRTGAFEAIPVKAGRFAGAAQPGERRVEVYAYRVTTGDFSGMKGEVKESLISPKYNLESTLTADVSADKPNEFAFAVTSK